MANTFQIRSVAGRQFRSFAALAARAARLESGRCSGRRCPRRAHSESQLSSAAHFDRNASRLPRDRQLPRRWPRVNSAARRRSVRSRIHREAFGHPGTPSPQVPE